MAYGSESKLVGPGALPGVACITPTEWQEPTLLAPGMEIIIFHASGAASVDLTMTVEIME